MIQTTRCPDASRWHALIADTDVPDYAELEEHLASCARCRQVLDEVAVGSSGWLRDASRLAGATDDDPEMTKTLHRLREFFPDDDNGLPIALDFLTPTDQPGLLGTLGRYQVMEVIGRGAMGIVLKAIDTDLLRPIAIKVMAPYLAPSGTARQRFLREARAAAAVSHDHIVTIHAVEPGELPYLVMEYVSGISLQARLDRDGPLPPKDIARIGHQAACGLAAAHAQGLVHRDIKPANILLENGVERVKITDFGLARAADDARLTQSGTAAGTPLYMSPEQTRGETGDHRSDLFSLGSVLYTLATGFPPFRAGNTMGVLNRIANDPPRPIRETVPDFPAALEAIIMQLLEKDPAKRFQLAADVSLRLSGFLADPQANARRRQRRVPRWLETSLPILAGILVLGVVLYFKTRQGTLVVEVDDPAIKVALDGEELTILGAGPQEVRLKPGTYHVRASKDGKPAKADPEIVKIERDGKQIVKVTAVAEAAPKDSVSDVDMRKMETELGQLIQQLVLAGKLKPGEMDPLAARLSALMMQATKQGTPPDKAREAMLEAYKVAFKISQELTNQSKAPGPVPVPGPSGPPSVKSDPEWEAKLDKLTVQFLELRNRLADTLVGALFAQPGPVMDLDKAVAGLRESERDKAKRLLSMRDQFALIMPRAQKFALQLPQATTPVPLRELENEYKAATKLLAEMEQIAGELGAKPVTTKPPVSKTVDNSWDDKLMKLTNEFQSLTEQLAKTGPGKLLLVAPPGTSPEKLTGKDDDLFMARRLLVLRNEFGLLVPRFEKEIGRWEKAALDARIAKERADAGVIPLNELEAAQLALKDCERSLGTTEKALTRFVVDLRELAAQLGVPVAVAPTGESAEASFKGALAEYDALVLRIVKTPVGRILVTIGPENSWTEEGLKTNNVLNVPAAIRLLRPRDEIVMHKASAEASIALLKKLSRERPADAKARDEAATQTRAAEQNILVRTAAIRTLLADLGKVADEIAPLPSSEEEFKKLITEYEALLLRLAKTTVGRIQTKIKPNLVAPVEIPSDFTQEQKVLATKLLNLRNEFVDQWRLFEGSQEGLDASKKDRQASAKGDPKKLADAEAAMRKHETDLRLHVEVLRGLTVDLKKLADQIEAAK